MTRKIILIEKAPEGSVNPLNPKILRKKKNDHK